MSSGITAVITLAGRREAQAPTNHNVQPSASDPARFFNAKRKLELQLIRSLETIQHRGPESSGRWISTDGLVGLGHTRLPMNDSTPTGFHNPTQTIIAVVNGEIYNHKDLRAEILQKTDYTFLGESCCESVLALYEHNGLEFLSLLNGEYALCIYDTKRQRLIAARDRSCVKPLFWTVFGEQLLITSEAEALLPFGWKPAWDVRSLRDAGWNAEERTIFQGLRKVPPRSYLTCTGFDHLEVRRYWDLDFPDSNIVETRNETEMVEEVRKLLLDAVRIRLQADFPVGIHLSGGLESSIILGMAQHLLDTESTKLGSGSGRRKLKGLNVAIAEGIEDDKTDLRHVESFDRVVMDEDLLVENFEAASRSSEQHYFDLGFVAKHYLSWLTRALGLNVILNGQGADEILAGYENYQQVFLSIPDKSWEQTELSEERRVQMLDEMGLLDPRMHFTPAPAYLEVQNHIPFSAWTDTYGESDAHLTIAENVDVRVRSLMEKKWHPLNSALYTWYKCQLPNLLPTCTGDRTDMSNSMEGRTPFLDYRLVEYVNGLPPSLKIRYNRDTDELVEKYILREAGKPFISDEAYKRKKHQHSPPIVYPIGGPLHRLMSKLITEENVEALGFLDWAQVRPMVDVAFESQAKHLMGVVFAIAQWVVLSQKFGIAKATEARFFL